MGDYRKLEVWQRSSQLSRDIYQATVGAPHDERFGLTSQMRRAAASISANICEGCGRNTDRELARSLRIALGSATELESHLLLSSEVGYLAQKDARRMVTEVKELRAMMATLARQLAKAPPGRKR